MAGRARPASALRASCCALARFKLARFKLARCALVWGALALGAVTGGALPAQAACRQALALGLDVSGSVDADEWRHQMDGLAQALGDPDVIRAFTAHPDAPVALYIYEWAGIGSRRVLSDWRDVTSAQVLGDIAATLRATPRQPHDPATALGEAMAFGASALLQRSDCWQLTLDISADGASNAGPRPRDIRAQRPLQNITINGLLVGDPVGEPVGETAAGSLSAYFNAEVIQGLDAFVETAAGYRAYRAAMTRKLLRELQTVPMGRAPTGAVPKQQAQSATRPQAQPQARPQAHDDT
ncbi:hypothetical protein AQS8620_02139 [Aquimixticola soesokkakensis]|uniref:VWFA domain-containing protein n=1 Tax=Aquimixticola soesokkakensis TaxID=1519096 RepID=A0A1Y5T1A2_9RHOB|nr:DUF1194 domain-containing protein [Aquimixticola soesokkakensis]SLN49797.1 hypothetical protein AQS8620_02139 [Aquimixticola soesokkakensis]